MERTYNKINNIEKKMRLYLYGHILRMILNGQGQRYSVNLLMLKSNV